MDAVLAPFSATTRPCPCCAEAPQSKTEGVYGTLPRLCRGCCADFTAAFGPFPSAPGVPSPLRVPCCAKPPLASGGVSHDCQACRRPCTSALHCATHNSFTCLQCVLRLRRGDTAATAASSADSVAPALTTADGTPLRADAAVLVAHFRPRFPTLDEVMIVEVVGLMRARNQPRHTIELALAALAGGRVPGGNARGRGVAGPPGTERLRDEDYPGAPMVPGMDPAPRPASLAAAAPPSDPPPSSGPEGGGKCCVCFAHPLGVCLVPCGHRICRDGDCGQRIAGVCPQCRAPVQQQVTMY